MERILISLAFVNALFALWSCTASHKSKPNPSDTKPPAAIQGPGESDPNPSPTPKPDPVDELVQQLKTFDPASEDGNRGYLQLVCEHQTDLSNHATWYRFVMRSLLNKIDLSRLLAEKDCPYIVSELFKSKRSMDRLEIKYQAGSPDWDLLQQINPQTDFQLLKHLKKFIKNLRIIGDATSDSGPLFLETMLHESGSFCSIELWTIQLQGQLDFNLEALGGCATRLMLNQVKLSATGQMLIHAPQGLTTSRFQIRGFTSPAAILEKITVDPDQTLNALNFTDESSQPLFIQSALNPFLLSSLSSLENFSDFSNRKFKPIDPPYLNMGDTAINDFSQVNAILQNQYLAFIQNNLPKPDASDRAKTCTSLMRFKSIKYQPSWYTQQNWQNMAPHERETFRNLAAGYEESCRIVRDAVVERLKQDSLFTSTCGVPFVAGNAPADSPVNAIELKSFNCKLSGVEFGS